MTTIFGERMKLKRLELGISRKDLAIATGVCNHTIGWYENHDSDPRTSKALKISKALEFRCLDDMFEPITDAEREKVRLINHRRIEAIKELKRKESLKRQRQKYHSDKLILKNA